MSIEAGVGVDLRAEMSALRGEMRDRHRHDSAAAKALTPWPNRRVASGSVASGDLALSLAGPDTGFYWMVHGVTIGGIQVTTAAAGTGELYVSALGSLEGGASGYAAVRLTSDLVDKFAALPVAQTYGDDQIVVQAGENLIAVVHTPSANQIYVAMARFHVYRTHAAVVDFVG